MHFRTMRLAYVLALPMLVLHLASATAEAQCTTTGTFFGGDDDRPRSKVEAGAIRVKVARAFGTFKQTFGRNPTSAPAN